MFVIWFPGKVELGQCRNYSKRTRVKLWKEGRNSKQIDQNRKQNWPKPGTHGRKRGLARSGAQPGRPHSPSTSFHSLLLWGFSKLPDLVLAIFQKKLTENSVHIKSPGKPASAKTSNNCPLQLGGKQISGTFPSQALSASGPLDWEPSS